MKREFKYRMDKRAGVLTWVITVLIALAVLFFVLYSRSGYFPIWFTFFAITILLLYILSIPRKIRVTDEAVEILCVVELTRIALEDIAVVRPMDKAEMKFSFPLLASYGFFGYYGWYYNFSEFSLFKVYATQWRNFVRIDDIYETTYVVSCDDAEDLVAVIRQAKTDRQKEMGRMEVSLEELPDSGVKERMRNDHPNGPEAGHPGKDKKKPDRKQPSEPKEKSDTDR